MKQKVIYDLASFWASNSMPSYICQVHNLMLYNAAGVNKYLSRELLKMVDVYIAM